MNGMEELHKNVMVLQDALYLHSIPKGENEDLLLFVVPQAHQTCCLKWVPSRCRTSRPSPYTILITRTFLVAWNGQTDKTNY